jgi:aminopeptidase N
VAWRLRLEELDEASLLWLWHTNVRATGGKRAVRFQPSPRMSTYLLALMVGEFESVEAQAEGTLVRVWTTPGKKEQGRFALDVSWRLLSFYNNYFGIPYPIPKLDLIAIPDFAAGAMENWGAITYR